MMRIINTVDTSILLDLPSAVPFTGQSTLPVIKSTRRDGLSRLIIQNEPHWLDMLEIDVHWDDLTKYHKYLSTTSFADVNSNLFWTFTHFTSGVINLQYINPGAINQALNISLTYAITTNEWTIAISLATNGAGSITTTPNTIIAAITANYQLRYYLRASNLGTGNVVVGAGTWVLSANSYIINQLFTWFSAGKTLEFYFLREKDNKPTDTALDIRQVPRVYKAIIMEFPEQLLPLAMSGNINNPVLLEVIRKPEDFYTFKIQIIEDGYFTTYAHFDTCSGVTYITRGY